MMDQNQPPDQVAMHLPASREHAHIEGLFYQRRGWVNGGQVRMFFPDGSVAGLPVVGELGKLAAIV
jgi:hypothetical protein